MSRPAKVLLGTSASIMVAAVVTACGTERIRVPQSSPLHEGAVLFSQRCSGCHTLSYAATNGSATDVRTRELTNGPNFNVRCERPVARVLYAIENGGFSGAIMPQNVVVGQDARDVAQFVSKYAGSKAAKVPGVQTCDSQSVGSLPSPIATTASSTTSPASSTASTASTTSSTASTTPKASAKHHAKTKAKHRKKS